MLSIFGETICNHGSHPFKKLTLGFDKLPQVLVAVADRGFGDSQAGGDQVKIVAGVDETGIRTERHRLTRNQVLAPLRVVPVVREGVLLQDPQHRLVRVPGVVGDIQILISRQQLDQG